MRILVAEDDTVSRKMIEKILEPYASCDLVEDGAKAVDKFKAVLAGGESYDLLLLDIMMPVLDGQTALSQIRDFELERGITPTDAVKVLMTTALNDPENIFEAHVSGCEGYIVKPITRAKVVRELVKLGLVSETKGA